MGEIYRSHMGVDENKSSLHCFEDEFSLQAAAA